MEHACLHILYLFLILFLCLCSIPLLRVSSQVWVQARSLGDPAEVLLFDKVECQAGIFEIAVEPRGVHGTSTCLDMLDDPWP